jgi:predicted ester cyclase
MDRDGFLQFLGALRSAFPDLAVTVEDLLAEGDEVAVRWTWRFGLLQQLGAIPAPGQPTG